MDGLDPVAFMLADEREHVAVTLAHDHDRLALARLIGEKAKIATVCLVIGRLYIAAKIGTIDLDNAAELLPRILSRHRLAQLVRQHERCVVLHVQIAEKLERGNRSQERRVGTEWVRRCRSRW